MQRLICQMWSSVELIRDHVDNTISTCNIDQHFVLHCVSKNCTPKLGRHKFCYFPNTKNPKYTFCREFHHSVARQCVTVIRVMSQVNGIQRYSAIWGSETPEPIELKFCMIDYVRDGTTHANFGGNQLSGGTGQIPHLYHYFVLFYQLLFFDAISKPTADTAEPILTRDSSYDVSS